MNKSCVFLEVPISEETATNLQNYMMYTGYDQSTAIENAIYLLTWQYAADKGYPKKGNIITSGKKYPCWVLGEKNDTARNIKLYRIIEEKTIYSIRADQVEIMDD